MMQGQKVPVGLEGWIENLYSQVCTGTGNLSGQFRDARLAVWRSVRVVVDIKKVKEQKEHSSEKVRTKGGKGIVGSMHVKGTRHRRNAGDRGKWRTG